MLAYVIENRSQMAAMNGNYCILKERGVDLSCLPESNPHPPKCKKCDLNMVWMRGSIQVPRCYMIVLTMLLGWFLIQIPGCWKAASINRWSPIENWCLLSCSVYINN